MIDKFHPDLLYTDGGSALRRTALAGVFPMRPSRRITPRALRGSRVPVQHLHRAARQQPKPFTLRRTAARRSTSVGVLDIEKSQLPGVMPQPWHTDTCIGNWFYDVHSTLQAAGPNRRDARRHHLQERRDAAQRPPASRRLHRRRGRIIFWRSSPAGSPSAARRVYGTRPWRVFGEGDARGVKIDGFTEDKTDWNATDFRFAQKNGALYAFMMGAKGGQPAGPALLHAAAGTFRGAVGLRPGGIPSGLRRADRFPARQPAVECAPTR